MKKIIALLVIVLSCGILYGQKYSKKKDYSDGLAAVYFQERWGFVDKNDKLVINYAFEDVKPFSNGVAQVKYQGKWIYIDKKGKVTSAPQIAQNTSKSSSSSNKSSSSSSNKSSSSSSYNKSNSSSSSKSSSSSSSYNSSSSKSSSSSSNSNSKSSSSSSNSYQTNSNNSSSSSKQDDKVKIYGKVTCEGVSLPNITMKYTAVYQGEMLNDGDKLTSLVTGKTDANGNYSLYVPRKEASLSDGYIIVCNEEGYVECVKYFENKSNYKKYDQCCNVELSKDYYELCGKVTSNGSGVGNARVWGRYNGDNFGTTTDSYGNYTIKLSRPSYGEIPYKYTLFVTTNNYEEYSTERQFDINRSHITHNVSLENKSNYTRVHGKVTYNGSRVPNAEVSFYDYYAEKTYRTKSDAYGNYEVTIPRDVYYMPMAQHANYDTDKKSSWNAFGKEESVDFEFTKYYPNSSSSTSSSSSSDGSAIDAAIVGAVIVGGIAAAVSSRSSSSSGSSSGNNKATNDSEEVLSKGGVVITRRELYEHNVLTGKFDHVVLYLRNNNNHDVFVTIEMKVKGTWEKCSITYENKAATEPLNGSYADNGSKEIHLKGNSTRVVEVTSHSTRRPDAIRITDVF